MYLLQYLFNSLIIISDNKNTAIKFGTAKNNVKASDKFTTLFKFIAEPIIINKQYIIWKVRGQWFDVTVNGKSYRAMAIFHPSYLLRNHSMDEGSPRRLMQQDLAVIKSEILADNKVCSSNPFSAEMAMV